MSMRLQTLLLHLVFALGCALLGGYTLSALAYTPHVGDMYFEQAIHLQQSGHHDEAKAVLITAGNEGSYPAAMHLATMYSFGEPAWSINQDKAYAQVWIQISYQNLQRPENKSFIGSESHVQLLSLIGMYYDKDKDLQLKSLRQCVKMAKKHYDYGYVKICKAMLSRMH